MRPTTSSEMTVVATCGFPLDAGAVIIALGIAGAELFAALRTRGHDPQPMEERAPALDRAKPAAATAE